ncbi:MAG: DNA-binding response regulator [Anaerolineae bacterium]|nr:response regulator transcription factor [Anaerolineales bacterium]MCQ3978487.1 DNA-binding response regulator [Anaerolineae bacterium]
MIQPIRIFLADDHAVLRAGLKALLNAEPDMEVVGEAGDGQSCIQAATQLRPDVILLDINMPHCNGLEALVELRRQAPLSRILILTMHDDAGYLRQVLAAGGAGYVLKQAADTELLSAIRTVYNGGVFLHPAHTKILFEDTLPAPSSTPPTDTPLARLSDRELEVLRLIALGHANKEIAEMLYLSVKSVETYKARLMEKLGLTSRAALVRFALEHGLLAE